MYENFLNSLQIMWKGMFGIFAVILLIMLVVMALSFFDKLFHKNKN